MNVRKCFFKPQNEEVKFEMDINMQSSMIDTIRAEEIAVEVDGPKGVKKKDKAVVFENGIVDKVIFLSSKVVKDSSNYAIGVFNGKELHLTSLKGNSDC